MFLDELKAAYINNKNKNPLLVRTMLKEMVQYYILDYIGKSIWSENFLFKGGTCLRIFFDLPRLSEDLDFDHLDYQSFDLNNFLDDLKNYFTTDLRFSKLSIKVANNKRTVYLKFPILKDLGLSISKNESDVLFVRLDFSPAIGKTYKSEISIKSTFSFSFLIKRYSLSDLFSGKIAAILTREALEGTIKKERFKGRDFFDLIWFLEKGIKPNWDYLKELTGFTKKEVILKLNRKVEQTKPRFLEADLLPFLENTQFVKNFAKNFQNLFAGLKKRF